MLGQLSEHGAEQLPAAEPGGAAAPRSPAGQSHRLALSGTLNAGWAFLCEFLSRLLLLAGLFRPAFLSHVKAIVKASAVACL